MPAQRRLSGEERAARIVEAAAALFAAQGFGGTTRELARRLGVTQALLYRYFDSKQRLIDRVFECSFVDRWQPAHGAGLTDRSRPLEDRLIEFYRGFVRRSDPVRMRLWMRANLDGLSFAPRFSGHLTDRILRPIVAELRHAAGLPPLESRPLLRGERELVMTLHGGIVFLAIRKHVYRMPMPEELDDVVELQVRAWLPGAAAAMTRLHGPGAPPGLTVPMVDRGRRRRAGPHGLPSSTHLEKVKV